MVSKPPWNRWGQWLCSFRGVFSLRNGRRARTDEASKTYRTLQAHFFIKKQRILLKITIALYCFLCKFFGGYVTPVLFQFLPPWWWARKKSCVSHICSARIDRRPLPIKARGPWSTCISRAGKPWQVSKGLLTWDLQFMRYWNYIRSLWYFLLNICFLPRKYKTNAKHEIWYLSTRSGIGFGTRFMSILKSSYGLCDAKWWHIHRINNAWFFWYL